MRAFVFTLIATSLALSGCKNMFEKEKIPLTGKRESVLVNQEALTPSAEAQKKAMVFPAATTAAWSQNSGSAHGVRAPGQLAAAPKKIWETSIQGGSTSTERLLSTPVTSDTAIFALNTQGEIHAFDLKTGETLWYKSIVPAEGTAPTLGGGVSYSNGMLYAGTAFGEVIALSAQTGDILWRHPTAAPVRVAPSIAEGHIYVLTINNEVAAFDQKTGTLLWTHAAAMETAGLLGGATPSVQNGVVVAAFSSGEVFALRTDNGYPLWTETLTAFRRVDSVSSLPHIRAKPLLLGRQAFIVSHSGRAVSLNIQSGEIFWEREIGAVETPAAVGDFLFLVTLDQELVCLTQDRGLVKWAVPLSKVYEEQKLGRKVFWAGPIALSGERLALVSSEGELLFFSAKNGEMISRLTLPSRSLLSPIVSHGRLFVLTNDGILAAYE